MTYSLRPAVDLTWKIPGVNDAAHQKGDFNPLSELMEPQIMQHSLMILLMSRTTPEINFYIDPEKRPSYKNVLK